MTLPDVEDIYPLTPVQQGLLFHSLYAPEASLYCAQVACRIDGELDAAALRGAWEHLLRSHPVLRTSFLWEGLERPLQVVHARVDLPWTEEDWRNLDAAEQARRWDTLREEDWRRGFDPAKPPLLRLVLVRVAVRTHRFLWSQHHLLLDGWSSALVIRDLQRLYEELRAARPVSLGAGRPYRDYLAWLDRQDPDESEVHWRRALQGYGAPARLPLRQEIPGAGDDALELALPAKVTGALQILARQLQVSLNAVVQGAWALLLARYCDAEDIVYGVTLSCRPPEMDGAEEMVGLFINSLPMRVRAAPGATVSEWLRQIHAQQWELQEHAQTPLVRIHGWCELPAGVPLFEALYVFENYPVHYAAGPDPGTIGISDILTRERTNYPLSAVVLPGPELRLRLLYAADRIGAKMAGDMLRHWRHLLEGLAADPWQQVSNLPLLTPEEHRRAVAEWNDTACDYPRESCIHRLFEVQAALTPETVAVSWDGEELRYAELNRRANRLARHLRALGVAGGVPVGLHLRRSPCMVVALLAVLKAGGAYVPLDTSYPTERLALMLRDCAAPLVLVEEDGAGIEGTTARPVPIGAALDALLEGIPEADLPGALQPEDPAYVIYTSGSTGLPKGVVVPHRAVVRLVRNTDFAQLGPADRVAQASNTSFDAATFEVWGALLNGGTLVGVEREVTLSPRGLAAFLRRERISAAFLTTALFNRVAEDAPGAFSPLRHLLFGGEAVDPAAVLRVLQAGGPERLLHVYGPTENTTFSTWHRVTEVPPGASTLPIGRAIANSRIYVLDRHLRPCPVGVPGELYVGGDGLALGYLHRPELTEERFLRDPFGPAGARLYRTGDLGRYRADGAVEFIGRRDGQIKLRGFRVELGEIETALARHPDIREGVVVHAEGRLAAYAVPRQGARPDRSEIRRHLAKLLPDHMIPAEIALIDALPLNANGKIARDRLPEIRRGGTGRTTLRSATETIIAGVWSRVLDVPEIGAEDNFFELGGHSLLATQVVSRLREALGVELPLQALFRAPSLADLAERVDAARRLAAPPPPIRPAGRDGPRPLSFAQERLWFLDQLEPGRPFYIVPIALRLRGELDVAALRAAIEAVVRRHEVLRTSFPALDGRPSQRIAARADIPLPLQDLSPLPEGLRADEAERLIQAEARRPFDLAAGPLLRTGLLRLGPDEHVLLFTMHHIVADGWSLGVLVRELVPLYRACRSGAAAADLPDLPIQYADFAAWQRDWLRGEVLEAQLTYWREKLTGVPPVLHLPTDRPRPPAQSYRGSSLHFRLDREVADGLRRLGRRNDATPFMILLAAFATLLHRQSGEEDLVIGSPIANRNRAEIEPLIGFFVNTLALRIDLRGEPSFEELLGRVRQTALDAYAHQDLPFERLVDELQPERDLSLNPLFQVMFTLQNAPLGRLDLPGLSAELLETRRQTALFDLVLDMWEAEGTLRGILEYNTDLFDEASIARLVGSLQTLLAAMAEDPARRLDELPCLTAAEEEALLRMGSGPRRDYPVERPLHALFEAVAARHRGRIAAVHDGRRVTYAELDASANRIAHRLRGLGVSPGSFVALLDDRGIDLLAAMLGTLKAGAAFLPVDPAYPVGRIRHMLADSGAPVLVTRAARLGELPPGIHAGAHLLLDAGDRSEVLSRSPPASVTGGDLAYMLYTSGSTGLPKGAMVRHAGAVNHICAELELLGCDRDLVFLQSAPSSSDISVWQFLAPLLIGGRTVVVDATTVADPAALLRLIREEGVSLIELVPVVLKALLDHAGALPPEGRALPRLAWAMVTGEAASPGLVNQWLATWPDIPLVNAYGPTEAADDICQAVLDRPLSSDRAVVPIGRPLPNLTLYVLDRKLRLQPVGVPGEICVSGIGVGAGYWGDAAGTGESFLPNPYAGEGRGEVLYRTGDLGRWLPDGTLECLERIDHQVKLRGFRIELGEIEGVLGSHRAVREAAVALAEDVAGDRMLAAYVVPDAEAAEVRTHLQELRREQVGLWQELHDDSYREELLRGDATFNVVGWDSNYTGLPLPEADMRDYVEGTVERIRALGPGRVLEIGCGTGLIMFGLLPHCAGYTGTDLSRVTIERLQELQASPALSARIPGLERAALRCSLADDLGWLEPGAQDTVVLPSVVQYFPGIDYLLQVLDGIFGRVLAPGGSVFVGDVRSLPLLEAFHASVQLHRADPAERSPAVAARVRQRLAQEQELAIDPGFFLALAHRYPAIRQVEILPKRGTQPNEMTRFRYDVAIRTSGSPVPAVDLLWESWRQARPGPDALRRRLAGDRPAVLALRRVANARVAEALAAAEHLLRSQRDLPAGEVRALAAADAGLEPEALWQLGRECGYRVDLSLAAGHADGAFDAVFRRQEGGDPSPLAWTAEAPRPWARYANNPLQEKLGRRLAPLLRDHLKERLPHYMVPSSFTLLAALPQTPAGKLDRQALPAPRLAAALPVGGLVAPQTPAERALVRIWAEVLGLPEVGARQNFFELGGHSLKATQVVSRIHRNLGVQLPLREIFAHPTIAELALRLAPEGEGFAAIPKRPDAEHHPLSHAQRRLWVLSQLEGGSVAYNMPLALRLDGPLDAATFRAAHARLVERHEALRTAFVLAEGAPRQRILPAGVALDLLDLSDAADPEGAARTLALEDATAPFDLERGAVRAALLRLAPDRHVLLLTMHHIVSDDWSMSVLVREFVALYAALSHGAEPGLPPLPLQYRDYAVWQEERLAGPVAAAHRDYWHRRLGGTLPVLQLATDLPRPVVKTYRGQSLGLRLGAAQLAALAALGRGRGASLFMVLAAIVKVLLFRYSGQEDILIGFPIAGRDHADLEGQIGCYVNTLPLRDRVHGEGAFLELLDQVRTTATEAYEHQAYPFDRLVEELDVPRDVGRSPMFDVAVVMQNAGAPAPALTGIEVRPFVRDYAVSKFDLSFTFEEGEGGLRVDITFNTDLFLPERIRRMGGHFAELVMGVLADPTMPVGQLRLMPVAERQEILQAGMPRAAPAPQRGTLATLFERQAVLRPEKVALVVPATEAGPCEALSYAALNARANRLAHALRGMGVGPETLVALCLPRSLDLLVGILGILKAGGAYLPLEPAHPTERLAFMVGDAGAAALVTGGGLAGFGIPEIRLDRDAAALATLPDTDPAPAASAESLAYVIYTSGSTGRPKGVAVTHRNVLRLFAASKALFGFDASDVWTLFHSCAFDFSVWEIWGALLHGGRLVIVPQEVTRSPGDFLALLAEERVTVLNQTPSAFRQLMQEDAEAGRPLDLRHVVFGGEALDPRSLRPWFARHGDARPRLVNMYGITETTVHVTWRPLSVADLEAPGSPIGQSLPDLALHILDAHGEPVPPGVVGEIHVGGAGVARGYLNRPDLTAARFIADPFADDPAAQLYRSGDLARRHIDGEIEYCGRGDQQVQLRGFRIELGEIEAALAAHPAVRDAVVLPYGAEEQLRLVGYVVPAAGGALPDAELRRHLRAQLPEHMVPSALIAVGSFPLNANGKLDRTALPRPEEAEPAPGTPYTAPEGALERQIAAVFEEVLRLDRVGLHDNFFDLGANSLLLVQVHRRLREALRQDLPVVSLFRFPTVAALAAALAAPLDGAAPAAVVERAGARAARRRAAHDRRRGPSA